MRKCVRKEEASTLRKMDKNVGVKIPHVGWNEVTFSSDPIFKNLREKEYLIL